MNISGFFAIITILLLANGTIVPSVISSSDGKKFLSANIKRQKKLK